MQLDCVSPLYERRHQVEGAARHSVDRSLDARTVAAPSTTGCFRSRLSAGDASGTLLRCHDLPQVAEADTPRPMDVARGPLL